MKNAKIRFSIFLTLSVVMLLIVSSGLAQPNLVPATDNKAKEPVSVIIPEHAVQIAEGVFSLGQARDVDGKIVEGFLFIDKRNDVKPSWAGGGKSNEKNTCFSLLAKGAKWKTTEKYITDTDVNTTLTETSLETWDSEVGFDIFGFRNVTGTVDGADEASPDGKNEVMFEDLGVTSTVAYTIVWGIFRGNPKNRELVEWDVVFNSNYDWSLSGEDNKMDYQNVATHEFGHALGLGHPDDGCVDETMYRFVSKGETKKHDLNAGDITGVNEIYGG